MKDLKELLLEYTGVSNWTSRSTWNTVGKDENLFKKLAIGLQDRNYDKVKDSFQKFCDELQKRKDVTVASRRIGSSPNGKFAIGLIIVDTGDEYKDCVALKLKFDKRVLHVSQGRKSCEMGMTPFSDWESRGKALDIWAHCPIILSIDEDSPLIDEMEEFAYNSGLLEPWIKSFN